MLIQRLLPLAMKQLLCQRAIVRSLEMLQRPAKIFRRRMTRIKREKEKRTRRKRKIKPRRRGKGYGAIYSRRRK